MKSNNGGFCLVRAAEVFDSVKYRRWCSHEKLSRSMYICNKLQTYEYRWNVVLIFQKQICVHLHHDHKTLCHKLNIWSYVQDVYSSGMPLNDPIVWILINDKIHLGKSHCNMGRYSWLSLKCSCCWKDRFEYNLMRLVLLTKSYSSTCWTTKLTPCHFMKKCEYCIKCSWLNTFCATVDSSHSL